MENDLKNNENISIEMKSKIQSANLDDEKNRNIEKMEYRKEVKNAQKGSLRKCKKI